MAEQWWQTGFDAEVMNKPAVTRDETRNLRFWLRPNETRTVIFLTAKPEFCVWEHNVKINGKWGNHATCLKMIKQECALCLAGEYASGVSVFTVIDLTEYTDKKGVKHEATKRLFVAKSETLSRLQHQIKKREEKDQSLRGAVYEIHRTEGDKIPRVGDDFEFQEMADLSALADTGIDIVEFDYPTLFKPDPDRVETYAQAIGGSGSVGAGAKQVKY